MITNTIWYLGEPRTSTSFLNKLRPFNRCNAASHTCQGMSYKKAHFIFQTHLLHQLNQIIRKSIERFVPNRIIQFFFPSFTAPEKAQSQTTTRAFSLKHGTILSHIDRSAPNPWAKITSSPPEPVTRGDRPLPTSPWMEGACEVWAKRVLGK